MGVASIWGEVKPLRWGGGGSARGINWLAAEARVWHLGGRIGIYSASKCGQVAAEVLQGLQLGQGPSGLSARESSG